MHVVLKSDQEKSKEFCKHVFTDLASTTKNGVMIVHCYPESSGLFDLDGHETWTYPNGDKFNASKETITLDGNRDFIVDQVSQLKLNFDIKKCEVLEFDDDHDWDWHKSTASMFPKFVKETIMSFIPNPEHYENARAYHCALFPNLKPNLTEIGDKLGGVLVVLEKCAFILKDLINYPWYKDCVSLCNHRSLFITASRSAPVNRLDEIQNIFETMKLIFAIKNMPIKE